jgi:glycosyltransferase involved in cell wall biosynthesis
LNNKKITILIKSHGRIESLENLLKSIRSYAANYKVIIVDDGDQYIDENKIKKLNLNVELIITDYDIGLSAGRNLGVSLVETDFIMLADEDFLFTKNTNLETLLNELIENNYDILAIKLKEYGLFERKFYGTYRFQNNNLIRLIGKKNNPNNKINYYDFVLNCFLAKTNVLKENKWDPAIKIGYEHDDFFINLKKRGGYKIGYTDVSSISHYPTVDCRYAKNRTKRLDYYFKIFQNKHNIKKIKDEGSVFSVFAKIYIKIISIKKYIKLTK